MPPPSPNCSLISSATRTRGNSPSYLPRLALASNRDRAIARLRAAAATAQDDAPAVSDQPGPSDMAARRRAKVATALFRLGAPDTGLDLARLRRDSRTQAETIHALAEFDAEPGPLVARLGDETDPAARRGLLLALSDLAPRMPADVRRQGLVSRLLDVYRDDARSGRPRLRRGDSSSPSDQARSVDQIDTFPDRREHTGARRWFIDQGHLLVVIDPRNADPGLSANRPIDRVFAIADREVTLEQYRRFRPEPLPAAAREHEPRLPRGQS